MIAFNTEFEINFPNDRDIDYIDQVYTNVSKFLNKEMNQEQNDITFAYNPHNRSNIVSFNWKVKTDNVVDTEVDALNESRKMEYWFHHCPFFRKHNVKNFATSYIIKNRG